MTYELFVPQLVRTGAPLCTLCGGKTMNGLNCTCACEAMWLYRASQGKIKTSACHVRDLTDDCEGGNNLRQMEAVSAIYGIRNGMLYQPIGIDFIFSLIATGRFGVHLNISYAPVVGTPLDAFGGRFRGNHDIYLSRPGGSSGVVRVGDPGASGFRDWPKSLLRTAAGLLDLGGGVTLNEEVGGGKCYAYATPADPVVLHWWPSYAEAPPAAATFAVQYAPGTYWHYNSDGSRHGQFSTAGGFTAYGSGRFKIGTRLFGKLLTDRPGLIINVAEATRYWSK